MVNAWVENDELIKYPFILEAYIGEGDLVEYVLPYDKLRTKYVLDVMREQGYTCTIVENLLKEMK
jgi:hypothetical protein